MRIKTLPQIVKAAKKLDPDAALNESMLAELMASGNLPYEKHGNRTVSNMDAVIPCLNRMLGLNADTSLPRLRTIRGAVRELRQCRSELGIGEDHIRAAVNDGRIDCIRIGNRAYIAMEFFDEPYIQRFTRIELGGTERKRKGDSSAVAQIGEIIAHSQGIPMVKRVRKTA